MTHANNHYLTAVRWTAIILLSTAFAVFALLGVIGHYTDMIAIALTIFPFILMLIR